MVVTFLPAMADTCILQERTGWPLTWTVHAPHSAIPHPNLVPVMPSVSRSTHSKGMRGWTSTVWGFPLRENLIAAITPPYRQIEFSIQPLVEIHHPGDF